MIKKGVSLNIFLAVYILFSLAFHQGPLIKWLGAIVNFSSFSGVSAFLFIEVLSILLWVILLTPIFFYLLKIRKISGCRFTICECHCDFLDEQPGYCHQSRAYC